MPASSGEGWDSRSCSLRWPLHHACTLQPCLAWQRAGMRETALRLMHCWEAAPVEPKMPRKGRQPRQSAFGGGHRACPAPAHVLHPRLREGAPKQSDAQPTKAPRRDCRLSMASRPSLIALASRRLLSYLPDACRFASCAGAHARPWDARCGLLRGQPAAVTLVPRSGVSLHT